MMPSHVESVDTNLMTIRTIEGGWSLPPLPAEVSLDLASQQSLSSQAITELLGGLETDLQDANRRAPVPVRDALIPDRDYTKQEAGATALSLIGAQKAHEYSADAVQIFKQKAVEGGYLELSDTQIEDSRWLPEYGIAAREMAIDERKNDFKGDRPGNLSLEKIGQVIEDWFSPRGLYKAALALDLWWDKEAIGREASSWGEKFQDWGKEPWNPLKMIDALTGPIDDLVMPIVNWGLMLTGVGEVYATGRVLYGGIRGAEAVAGMYKGAQGIKYAGKFAGVKNALVAADRTADVTKLTKASFLSGKIAPKAGSTFLPGSREAVSGAMNAWRGNRNVAMARKANQQVMRLGIASNLEGTIDDETGGNIAKVSTIDEYVGQVLENDAVDWAIDLLFTPTSFLEPGAITGGLKAAGRGINKVTPGFKRVTENEKMTAAYLPAMRTWLQETKPDAIKQFDKDISKHGAVQAMANQITSGNVERLGSAMAFTTVSAAVDAHARRMASLGEAAVQNLDETNLGQFFAHRNKAQAQLTRLDLDDVDRAFEMMSLYGDESAIAVKENLKRPRKWRSYRERLREAHMEDDASFTARKGAVPEGHVRLYGTRAYDDHDVIKWAKENPGDDPFFVDLSEAEAARVLAGDDPGLTTRYMREVKGGARQRYRLSEANQVRVYDQEKLKNVRAIMDQHNKLRKGFVTELLNQTGPEVIEQYAYETLDTFGNWDNFQTMSHELRLAVARGDLDNVRFAPALSENNRRIGLMPGKRDPRLSEELFKHYVELPNRVDPQISRSTFAPFARDVDAGQARFTIAKIGADGKTVAPLKQEAVAHAHLVEQSIVGLDNLAALRRHPQWSEIQEAVDLKRAATLDAGDTLDMKGVVDEVIAELAVQGKTVERLRQLVRQANKRGVSLEDVEGALRKHLVAEHGNEIWSTRFGMGEDVMGRESADIVELMRARVKKLRAKSQFMASEVEDLPPGLAESMLEKGWKPVYGVQFVQPDDLMDVLPEIADVTMAQVRQAKLQGFFGRQDPEYIRKLKTRVVNSSLHAALTEAKRKGGKIALNLGKHGEDSGDMKKVIDDLWSILEGEQTVARDTLDSLRDARWVRKVTGRAKLSTTPMSVERLASELGFKDLASRLQKMGYTHDEALAIYHGLQKSQSLGFRHLGLYEIEAKLRANPVLTDGLRLFGSHSAKENLGIGKRVEGWAVQTGGVIGGSVLTSGQYLKDNPDEETLSPGHLASIAAGMVVGKMAGTSLAKRRGLIGESSGKIGQMADAWDHSKWADWAYLGDKMANMRDTFRFSLSPIFDASRYSEALILGQLEELPAGLKNLKVNQSPKGFRKILQKEFQAQGHDVHKARELADQEWSKVTKQFSEAAKGSAGTGGSDFDWETIDGIGRRFSSVGILGFSPADWMASTFGHLTKAGADPFDAYETVRKMYTYGTTGRSAAEVSVNFVFFPFSFTKKTLGHLSSFVQQDVGRMILIHDAARMYEKLSEHYNLEEVFRDRMPALQRLYRLNILAYGVGPGRFGGVNAGILESARETPGVGLILGAAVPDTDVIMNLFMPQGVQVKDEAEAENIWRSLQDVLPLFNDVEQLYGDLQQQTRVITSDTHMTAAGEVQHGYTEWRAYQAEILPALKAGGMTWGQAMADERIGLMIRQKRVEIQKKYPAWSSSMAQSASHPAALQMEKTQRILSPENEADLALAQFDSLMDSMSGFLGQRGVGFGNPEDIPPEVFDMMRGLAISMAKENPEFRRLYYRFYSHILGDITTEVQA